MNDIVQQSKRLAYLLRHRPEAAGLTLDNEGWCQLEQLVANTNLTRDLIIEIVRTDTKGRYALDTPSTPEIATKIRANQGHSTSAVKMTFTTAVPPIVLYHGTSSSVVPTILKTGLKPMSRHHVHLSHELNVAQAVGDRRHGDTTILSVDTKRMLADGFKFFISENGVWLVDAVPPKYLKVLP